MRDLGSGPCDNESGPLPRLAWLEAYGDGKPPPLARTAHRDMRGPFCKFLEKLFGEARIKIDVVELLNSTQQTRFKAMRYYEERQRS
jgi:hypothetical protein